MSYFVEGIQGSGKSTLVKLLSEIHPDHKVLEEGDYSPAELAWCAYMDREAYQTVPGKYSSLISEIQDRSYFEDDHVVVCYTKIRTEDPAFYQEMEKYHLGSVKNYFRGSIRYCRRKDMERTKSAWNICIHWQGFFLVWLLCLFAMIKPRRFDFHDE